MNLEKADQHQKIVLHSLQQRFIPARSTISRHHLNAYCHRPHQGTVATSDTAGQAFSAVMPHRLCETYLDSHLAPSLCLQPDRMHLNATKPPMPTDDAAQYSTLLQALQVSTSHCAKVSYSYRPSNCYYHSEHILKPLKDRSFSVRKPVVQSPRTADRNGNLHLTFSSLRPSCVISNADHASTHS